MASPAQAEPQRSRYRFPVRSSPRPEKSRRRTGSGPRRRSTSRRYPDKFAGGIPRHERAALRVSFNPPGIECASALGMSFGDMRIHFSRSQSSRRRVQCSSEFGKLNPKLALIANENDPAGSSDCAVVLHVMMQTLGWLLPPRGGGGGGGGPPQNAESLAYSSSYQKRPPSPPPV